MSATGPSSQRALPALACLVVVMLFAAVVWSLRPSGPQPSPSPRTREAPLGIISLQVAGGASRANEILSSWDAATLEQARHATFLDWFPFIPLYVVALVLGAMASKVILSSDGTNWLSRAFSLVIVGVIAAGIFDAIENLFLLCMIDLHLSGDPVIGPACPAGSAIFAWPKLVIVPVSALYVLVGFLSWSRRAVRRRADL
jgi:hypothetical protein